MSEYAQDIADDFVTLFQNTTAQVVSVYNPHAGREMEYIVTDNTGDGCFAYPVREVHDALTECYFCEGEEVYNVFCQNVRPLPNKWLARAILDKYGKRICDQSCMPIIEE